MHGLTLPLLHHKKNNFRRKSVQTLSSCVSTLCVLYPGEPARLPPLELDPLISSGSEAQKQFISPMNRRTQLPTATREVDSSVMGVLTCPVRTGSSSCWGQSRLGGVSSAVTESRLQASRADCRMRQTGACSSNTKCIRFLKFCFRSVLITFCSYADTVLLHPFELMSNGQTPIITSRHWC